MGVEMTRYTEDNELWRFETARYAVTLHAIEEDMDPSDSFESEDDVEFARSGDPAAWFCAAVRVVNKKTGIELGSDVLGGCSYKSFRDFYSGHRDRDPANRNTLAMKAKNVVICHYFPDMVSQAIDNARDTLANLAA